MKIDAEKCEKIVFLLGLAVIVPLGSYFISKNMQDDDPKSQQSAKTEEAAGETNPNTVRNYLDQELLDDNGNKYTLHKNADGSETARYDDGKEVTFKRDENGNVNYLSGVQGLLPLILTGYLLFSGGQSLGGAWNSAGNYVSTGGPLKPISQEVRSAALGKYTPAGGKIQDIVPPYKEKNTNYYAGRGVSGSNKNITVANRLLNDFFSLTEGVLDSSKNSTVGHSRNTSSNSSSKSSVGSVKTGFGSAGARSSAS